MVEDVLESLTHVLKSWQISLFLFNHYALKKKNVILCKAYIAISLLLKTYTQSRDFFPTRFSQTGK